MRKLSLILTTFFDGQVEDATSIHLKIDVADDGCPDCLKGSIAEIVVKQLGATVEYNDNLYHGSQPT